MRLAALRPYSEESERRPVALRPTLSRGLPLQVSDLLAWTSLLQSFPMCCSGKQAAEVVPLDPSRAMNVKPSGCVVDEGQKDGVMLGKVWISKRSEGQIAGDVPQRREGRRDDVNPL